MIIRIKMALILLLLTSLLPRFAFASNGHLYITFLNRTDKNVEFVPLVNGETEFISKSILPPFQQSADKSIILSKVTKRSTIFLKIDNEVIARIVLLPLKDKSDVNVAVYPPDPTKAAEAGQVNYKVYETLATAHPDCPKEGKCTLWSQRPSGAESFLHVYIDPK
jgi:hypothetical protein